MSEILELFVARAREVSIAEAAPRLGLALKGRAAEQAMPCPRCGGKDRFALNTAKNKWNCRGGAIGGNDAIGMAAHLHGLEVSRRGEFLEACGAVLGEPVPDGAAQLTDERRAEIEAEARKLKARAEAEAAERQKRAGDFREKELAKCRGIYEVADSSSRIPVLQYLRLRAGLSIEGGAHCCEAIRFEPRLTYWHGKDDRGFTRDIWCGPAMALPFVDGSGQLIGIHQTWIDMDEGPKFRPSLTAHGRIAPEVLVPADATSADAGSSHIELLPTKKMRGSKKGGLLPIAGKMSATRWVVGEGIENVIAWFAAELDDNKASALSTFYAAAGDIGNLAGADARTGRFAHPTDTKVNANGVARPVMMPSPEPDPERLDEGFPLGPHVRELLFLGDGDSEQVWTAAHMARAEARAVLIAPGVEVGTVWPPRGADWADIIVNAQRGEAA
jgi:hypothetical protein